MSAVYTPGGLSYHASLTLPSDGDPAVVASVNAAGFHYLADNTAFLRLQQAKVFNVRNYGAVGDGSTNDLPAFQAAMSAASGGGILYIPLGYYVLNGGLTCNPAVSLVGDPFSSILLLNHATDDFLTFDNNTGTGRPATRIANLGFGALVANTGKVLHNTGADVECLVDNCDFNGINVFLNGSIFYNGDSASRWTFRDCNVRVRGNVTGFLQGDAAGQLNLIGNNITAPSTYAEALVYLALGGANIVGNSFDFTAHSSGTDPVGISVSSGGNTPVNITGNRFFTTTGSGPTKFGLSADSGCMIVSSGNSYAAINRYKSVGLLANGSELDILPSVNVGSSGSTYTISTGVRTTLLRLTGTAPTLTLPPILYPGQVLELLIYNASLSPWAGVTCLGGLPTGFGGVLSGGIMGLIFVAQDYDLSGTPEWVCISERS